MVKQLSSGGLFKINKCTLRGQARARVGLKYSKIRGSTAHHAQMQVKCGKSRRIASAVKLDGVLLFYIRRHNHVLCAHRIVCTSYCVCSALYVHPIVCTSYCMYILLCFQRIACTSYCMYIVLCVHRIIRTFVVRSGAPGFGRFLILLISRPAK